MDHQSSREVVKTCEWKKRLLEKPDDETAACVACLGNLPIHVERALELCGAPSLGESREGIESNEARIGMRNVIEPGEQGLAAKNAEFPIIDWLVIQPLFLNDGLIHPDTVPLFSFGGPLHRMHPAPASEAKPGSNGCQANRGPLEVQPADCGAGDRGDRGTEHLRNLEDAVKGYSSPRRVIFDSGRCGTGC